LKSQFPHLKGEMASHGLWGLLKINIDTWEVPAPWLQITFIVTVLSTNDVLSQPQCFTDVNSQNLQYKFAKYAFPLCPVHKLKAGLSRQLSTDGK
jgi:hypothetical protein